MWNELLAEAEKLPEKQYQKDPSLYTKVFNALFYSGRLPYEEFKYPAYLAYNIPPPRPTNPRIAVLDPCLIAQAYLDLGLVNHAELMSYWAKESGDDPVCADKQLVLIYILKENFRAARPLLMRLKKTIHQRSWAEKYLKLLDDKSALGQEESLSRIRKVMIDSDFREDEELLIRLTNDAQFDYEGVFNRLLEKNKHNKMAFEYLMSYYLLTGQTQKVEENLPRLSCFAYPGIPHNYQEAVLINMIKGNAMPQKLPEKMDKALADKYRYFYETYRKYKFSDIDTLNELKDKHPGSYFIYYLKLRLDKNEKYSQI